MKSRIAMVWIAALAGCSKVSVEPHNIAPDGVSSSSGETSVASGGSGGGSMGESGTRLKVASYAGEDGSRFTRAEAFDSTLGFYCRFLLATDGSTRCFPLAWTSGLYYADAECLRAIAFMPECDIDDPRYATTSDVAWPDTCQTTQHRVVRIESAPRETSTVYDNSGARCSPLATGRSMVVDVTVISTDELAKAALEVDGT